MTPNNRSYIRCAKCLSIGVIEFPYAPGWHCSICGGEIEFMGRVVQEKLEVEKERSACDKRCTHAVGPICVCKCGCENHGTGRVVTIKVLQELPVIVFEPDEVARERAEGFEQKVADLKGTRTRWQAITQDQLKPYTYRRGFYSGAYALKVAIQKAVEARTWKARQKHLDYAGSYVKSVEQAQAQV